MQYVYMIRVCLEGLDVPDVIPRMATMSEDLVCERIAVCKAMGGPGCGEVCMINPFTVLHAQSTCYNLLSVITSCPHLWTDGR